MSNKQIPVLTFQEGLKLAKASKAGSMTSFYFRGTSSLLKLLTDLTKVMSVRVQLKGQTWFQYQLKVKKTHLEVFVRGFGANQMVLIKKS